MIGRSIILGIALLAGLAAYPAAAKEHAGFPGFAVSRCDAGPEERIVILTRGMPFPSLTMPPRNYGYVPDSDVRDATRILPRLPWWRRLLGQTHSEADRAKVRLELRLYVLDHHRKLVALNRDWLVEHDAGEAAMAEFDAGVAWAEDICATPPAEVYALSRKLRLNGEGRLGSSLFSVALDGDDPDALFEFAEQEFLDGDRLGVVTGTDILREIAFKGHVPALREIIRRSREGDGVKQDRGEAYFWMLRAKELGLKVDEDLQALEPWLSLDDRHWIKLWQSRGVFPKPWDRR